MNKKLHTLMKDLIHTVPIIDLELPNTIMNWATPVPFFGHLDTAGIASVGLNPSNREFVNKDGYPLAISEKRFHTLASLELDNWESIRPSQIFNVIESNLSYFEKNPYDLWFKKLDMLLRPIGSSFYRGTSCHLDLVPYATYSKWGDLNTYTKGELLSYSGKLLAQILAESHIHTLILNGASVVRHFQSVYGIPLNKMMNTNWNITQANNKSIQGFSFCGYFDQLLEINMHRRINVLGYNINIQSSFGVTNEVCTNIGSWLSNQSTRLVV